MAANGLTADEASRLGAMLRNAKDAIFLWGISPPKWSVSHTLSQRGWPPLYFRGTVTKLLAVDLPNGVMRANMTVLQLGAAWLNRIRTSCRRS